MVCERSGRSCREDAEKWGEPQPHLADGAAIAGSGGQPALYQHSARRVYARPVGGCPKCRFPLSAVCPQVGTPRARPAGFSADFRVSGEWAAVCLLIEEFMLP